MFKAFDTRHERELVVLDDEWRGKIDYLRALARRDAIVCPVCKQPVRLKAGGRVRRHFAHKHRHGCRYGEESLPVLEGRACLYRWLQTRFPHGVTVEKDLGDDDIPHPVDCWVEHEGRCFAYWIVGKGLKPDVRYPLIEALSSAATAAHYVFLADMLREDSATPNAAYLSTTERDLMARTPYDELYSSMTYLTGGSLHYLDAEQELLMTLRNAMVRHEPQYYKGEIVASPLHEVLVCPETGQFLHPGEKERLAEHRASLSPAESRWQSSHPEYAVQAGELPRACAEAARPMVHAAEEGPYAYDEAPPAPRKEGTCVFCGARTTDWWWFDGATGTCRCRPCYRKGLVAPEEDEAGPGRAP